MSEHDAEDDRVVPELAHLPAVEKQLRELQRRKRKTVRWHMSRDTAERAIAAITEASIRRSSGRGKPRRRKRRKRLL